MPTTTVEVQELPTRFAELIALAAAGTEVILTENNVPKAKLVPVAAAQVRVPGLHRGAMTASPDFDAPLPEEFWTGAS
jgi:prevent-host-death family protein